MMSGTGAYGLTRAWVAIFLMGLVAVFATVIAAEESGISGIPNTQMHFPTLAPVQEAKLAASDAQSDDLLGNALAVAGDTLVIGAPGEDGGPGDPLWHAGAAYVFARNQVGAHTWVQEAKLTAAAPGFHDEFGQAVAISGDTVAVGAPYENGGAGNPLSDAGAVYIFERNQGGADNWGQVVKLAAGDPGEEDDFGLSLSLSGDTLVVGAPSEDGGPGDPLPYAGAVYIFERNEGGPDAWGQVAKLTAVDAQSGDGFGYAVAVSGDTLVVGAPSEDGGLGDPLVWAGAAYIFERNEGGPGNWGPVTKLASGNPQMNGRFGSAVAIDGDTLVVTTPFATVNFLFVAGAAYIFDRYQGGANNWGEVRRLVASDPGEGDFFAAHVAVSGDVVVAGAASEGGGPGTPLPFAGAAYVFERDEAGPGNWGEVVKLTAADAAGDDRFGSAVAVSSNIVFVGALDGDADGPPPVADSGAAYVFCLDDDLEENDALSQATAVTSGNYPGLQICSSDDDYFSLALTAGDTVDTSLLFRHATGNLDLALLDEDEKLLAWSDSVTDNEHFTYTIPVDGSYFIRAYGFQGARAAYTLVTAVAAGEINYPLYIPLVQQP